MKKKIVITLLCALSSMTTWSQTYHYSTPQTIVRNGYSYKCDIEYNFWVILYNAEDQLVYAPLRYKDGRKLDGRNGDDRILTMEEDSWTKPATNSILKNAFTAQDLARFKAANAGFILVMIVSSETGRVIEVHFEFSRDRLCATIPVETYRSIELALKRDIYFIPTAFGRQLNYFIRSMEYEFD